MSAAIATTEPTEIVIAQTVQFTKSVPDYLPGDGWALVYGFSDGTNHYKAISTDNGDGTHLISFQALAASGFKAGDWRWQSLITNSTQTFPIGRGRVKVRPDIITSAGDDFSVAERTLKAIRNLLLGKFVQDVQSYSYGGRALSSYNLDELERIETKVARQVAREHRAEARMLGKSTNRNIRFKI